MYDIVMSFVFIYKLKTRNELTSVIVMKHVASITLMNSTVLMEETAYIISALTKPQSIID